MNRYISYIFAVALVFAVAFISCKKGTSTVKVTGITLNKSTISIPVGGSEQLMVTEILPSNAAEKGVTWSSDNTARAMVDPLGKVLVPNTAAAGTVNITATAKDGSDVKATCMVTVTSEPDTPPPPDDDDGNPNWLPTERQLTNTAVETAGTLDISGSGAATVTITIDKSTTYQDIWGFGASIVGPATNFRRDLSTANQNKVFDLLFLNEGDNVGLTVSRLNINPQIWNVQANPYRWEQDDDQVWFAQQVYKRYPTPITASPWTPPAWMKQNNSVNDGYFRFEYTDKLAQWLYDWAHHYRDHHNLNVKWLSIQNEPNAEVTWNGCRYNPAELEGVLLTTIDYFRSKNSPVWVGGPECGNDEDAQKYLDAWSANTRAQMDWIAHHGYKCVNNPPGDRDFRKYGKPCLMTEQCSGSGNNEVDMDTDGLRWAFHIRRALSRDEKGFLFWQIVRNSPSQSLLGIRNNQDFYEVYKRVYVFAQYSRFIRPGYIVVGATCVPASNENNYCVTAAKHPTTGNTSVIIANKQAYDITVIIKGLSGSRIGGRITNEQNDFVATKDMTATGSDFTVKIPAKSVVSIAEK